MIEDLGVRKSLVVMQIVLSCNLTAVMPDRWQVGWSTWLEDVAGICEISLGFSTARRLITDLGKSETLVAR